MTSEVHTPLENSSRTHNAEWSSASVAENTLLCRPAIKDASKGVKPFAWKVHINSVINSKQATDKFGKKSIPSPTLGIAGASGSLMTAVQKIDEKQFRLPLLTVSQGSYTALPWALPLA